MRTVPEASTVRGPDGMSDRENQITLLLPVNQVQSVTGGTVYRTVCSAENTSQIQRMPT
jgi:hypothetical protein